jgi:hypothetical protein
MRYTPEKLEYHRNYYHSRKHKPEFKRKKKLLNVRYKFNLSEQDYLELFKK